MCTVVPLIGITSACWELSSLCTGAFCGGFPSLLCPVLPRVVGGLSTLCTLLYHGTEGGLSTLCTPLTQGSRPVNVVHTSHTREHEAHTVTHLSHTGAGGTHCWSSSHTYGSRRYTLLITLSTHGSRRCTLLLISSHPREQEVHPVTVPLPLTGAGGTHCYTLPPPTHGSRRYTLLYTSHTQGG